MRPSGEAYVEIIGPDAKLRLALAKDRQVMPVSGLLLSSIIMSIVMPVSKMMLSQHLLQTAVLQQ